MNPDGVRREILIALASDDDLVETLVLKGGMALGVVHGLGGRSSLDVDYSIEGDFADPTAMGAKVRGALSRHFLSLGLVVFDDEFTAVPVGEASRQGRRWGGYVLRFKVIPSEVHHRFRERPEDLRRRALGIGSLADGSVDRQSSRIFTVQISKHEHCAGSGSAVFRDFDLRVYTLEMILAEKLRALCQQMDAYPRRRSVPRARDFHDIRAILDSGRVDMSRPGFRPLLTAVFAAKEVPLRLLGHLAAQREFHRPDWADVVVSLGPGASTDYDECFDAVIGALRVLEPPGDE